MPRPSPLRLWRASHPLPVSAPLPLPRPIPSPGWGLVQSGRAPTSAHTHTHTLRPRGSRGRRATFHPSKRTPRRNHTAGWFLGPVRRSPAPPPPFPPKGAAITLTRPAHAKQAASRPRLRHRQAAPLAAGFLSVGPLACLRTAFEIIGWVEGTALQLPRDNYCTEVVRPACLACCLPSHLPPFSRHASPAHPFRRLGGGSTQGPSAGRPTTPMHAASRPAASLPDRFQDWRRTHAALAAPAATSGHTRPLPGGGGFPPFASSSATIPVIVYWLVSCPSLGSEREKEREECTLTQRENQPLPCSPPIWGILPRGTWEPCQ